MAICLGTFFTNLFSWFLTGYYGEKILDCKYDDIKHVGGNDLYVVKEDGKWKIEDAIGTWYTLDGRKLSGRPTQRGMYIHNGKTVVVK